MSTPSSTNLTLRLCILGHPKLGTSCMVSRKRDSGRGPRVLTAIVLTPKTHCGGRVDAKAPARTYSEFCLSDSINSAGDITNAPQRIKQALSWFDDVDTVIQGSPSLHEPVYINCPAPPTALGLTSGIRELDKSNSWPSGGQKCGRFSLPSSRCLADAPQLTQLLILMRWPNASAAIPSPPATEPILLVRLPLPPAIPTDIPGACNVSINPRKTGCMPVSSGRGFPVWSLLPDGRHVLALIQFVGAQQLRTRPAYLPALQIIIVKTDDSTFANGERWKCIGCGLPAENAVGRHAGARLSPGIHGRQAVTCRTNVIDCSRYSQRARCLGQPFPSPSFGGLTAADNSSNGGSIRRLRASS